MAQLQLLQVIVGLGVELRISEADQTVKQEVVREHRRENLAVIVPVPVSDRLSVQADFAGFGRIKAGDNFGERRFPAAIATAEKNQFPAVEGQIDGAKDKIAAFFLAMIGVRDADQMQTMPIGRLLLHFHRANLGRSVRQGQPKLFNLLQGDVGAAEQRDAAHDAGQWSHQIQRGHHVAAHRPGANALPGRQKKQNQAHEQKEQQVAPVVRENETDFGGDVVTLKVCG